VINLLVAAFLLAHAAIHFAFVSPRPPATAGGPPWPFDLGRSPVLSPLGVGTDLTRTVGLALVVVTVAGFALAALAAVGVVPNGLWQPAVVIGAVASIGVLGLFFHPWLVLGIAIDIGLIWAVTIASWQPA
jgi:hypothetical protein